MRAILLSYASFKISNDIAKDTNLFMLSKGDGILSISNLFERFGFMKLAKFPPKSARAAKVKIVGASCRSKK